MRGLQNAMIYHDIRSVMKLRSVHCTFVYCFLLLLFRPESGDPQRSLPFPGGSQFHSNWFIPCFSPMRAAVSPAVRFIRQGVQVAGRIHQSGICRVAGQDPKTTSETTSSITESIREKLVDTIDIARYLSFAKSLKSLKPID